MKIKRLIPKDRVFIIKTYQAEKADVVKETKEIIKISKTIKDQLGKA